MFLVKECACPKVWVIAKLLFLVKIFSVVLTGPGGELLLSLVIEVGERLVIEVGEGQRSSCPSREGRVVPMIESLCPPERDPLAVFDKSKAGLGITGDPKTQIYENSTPCGETLAQLEEKSSIDAPC